MTLIVETGSGLRISNSYVTVSFVLAYLTERDRETENSFDTSTTAEQEAAVIAATDYIDSRWGKRFKGTRNTFFGGATAQALINFTGIPVADETFTLGTTVYIWKAALTTLAADEVIIGADADESATNLIAAINGDSTGVGVTFSKNLPANDAATAALEESSTTSILLTVRIPGESGNDTPLAETMSNFDLTTATFVNGADRSAQALEFPRLALFDENGLRVLGVPLKLKQSCAEYAVRSIGALLYQDPTVDATGRTVTEKFEKIGPIEERTKFEEGGSLSQLIKPYPAADRLLAEFVFPAGRAFRG